MVINPVVIDALWIGSLMVTDNSGVTGVKAGQVLCQAIPTSPAPGKKPNTANPNAQCHSSEPREPVTSSGHIHGTRGTQNGASLDEVMPRPVASLPVTPGSHAMLSDGLAGTHQACFSHPVFKELQEELS